MLSGDVIGELEVSRIVIGTEDFREAKRCLSFTGETDRVRYMVRNCRESIRHDRQDFFLQIYIGLQRLYHTMCLYTNIPAEAFLYRNEPFGRSALTLRSAAQTVSDENVLNHLIIVQIRYAFEM